MSIITSTYISDMAASHVRKRSILGTRVEVWAVKRLARRAALVIQDRFHGPIPARAGQPPPIGCNTCAPRAYPRSRGATCLIPRNSSIESGLSPLARGNLQQRFFDAGDAGPIPARAGQPISGGTPSTICGAYPRSRGATPRASELAASAAGLSPLARGNRLGRVAHTDTLGPIPARAGQPNPGCLGGSCMRAYPRSRGATSVAHQGDLEDAGLSPLARGNRD